MYTKNKYLKNNSLFKSLFLIFFAANTTYAISGAELKKDSDDVELTRRLDAVGTGPYFGIGSEYDGSDLVVLQPNIHKDLGILKQQQRTARFTGETCGPKNPYVQLSGFLEAQATLETESRNHINLTASNLDLSAWVNKYFSAYTNFGVDTDDTSEQNFRMILGFITIGNLNVSPFYASAGQMFVPFGSFSTGTSSIGAIPRSMGRIVEQAISAGYYSERNGLHITGAVYDGKTQNSNHRNVDQFAGTISHNINFNIQSIPSSLKTGVSYTNNIADAAVLRSIFKRNASLRHYVPGIDVFAKFNFGPIVLREEYVTALEKFNKTDITQNGHSVKPGSFLSEIEYDTYIYGKGTAFVLHYSRIFQGALASPIKHQYGFNTTVNVLKDTMVSLEYAIRSSYSNHNLLPTPTATTFTNLNPFVVSSLNSSFSGRNKSVLVLTLDLFF